MFLKHIMGYVILFQWENIWNNLHFSSVFYTLPKN